MIVGITGGIGSGKSAVTRYLETKGIAVVDADLAARVIVEPGRPVLEQLQKRYGDEILLSDGNLNRPWLREKIFGDSDERKWVESVMHPEIRNEILRQLDDADSPYKVLVSPLLLETSQHEMVDRVLVVDVPESVQIERTTQRDSVPATQVEAILKAQTSRQNRLDKADDVVDNSLDLPALHQQVDKLHEKYLKLCQN
ncbi:dephospho-CoA kinase [Endozoicomonadaceae bacterium StTr2]